MGAEELRRTQSEYSTISRLVLAKVGMETDAVHTRMVEVRDRKRIIPG
jgi:hypothetical protein